VTLDFEDLFIVVQIIDIVKSQFDYVNIAWGKPWFFLSKMPL